MSHVADTPSSLPSPATPLTYLDKQNDPMDSEPHLSPVRGSATTRNRFSPYAKQRPALHPTHQHPHAIFTQARGPCRKDLTGRELGPSEAMDIFVRGIEALPNHILRSAVHEKFAMAERRRLQLLLATWDLEETKRRVHTLEQIQAHIEDLHSISEMELKAWKSMYSDRGLPDLKEDELFFGDHLASAAREADREATELTVMVEHASARDSDINTTGSECEDIANGEDLEIGEDGE